MIDESHVEEGVGAAMSSGDEDIQEQLVSKEPNLREIDESTDLILEDDGDAQDEEDDDE